METENKKQSLYRVERWWNPGKADPTNEENWSFYRSHNLKTLEEVEAYIKKHNILYRLVVYKVDEELVRTLEPTYEGCMTEEEYQKFLDEPGLAAEEIEKIKKEWSE